MVLELVFRMSDELFAKNSYARFVLGVNVGSTTTALAVFGVNGSKSFEIILRYQFRTGDIEYVHDLINQALREAHEGFGISMSLACIGAAGPVHRNRSRIDLTNVDLVVSEKEILKNTLLNKVIIVNDFEALGYGIDFLDLDSDVVRLSHQGVDLTGGWTITSPAAVIGAQAGLGMAIAYYDRQKHLRVPLASEGGHIDFAPYDDVEFELVQFLREHKLSKSGVHPELERVLSAQGLVDVFEFFINRLDVEHPLLAKPLDEQLAFIRQEYGKHEACTKAVDLFFRVYARAARYLALMSECYAGLFIIGSFAEQFQDLLLDSRFMKEFESHDKRSDVLRKIPVYVVKNDVVGLFGCCNVAVNFFNV